MDDTQLKVQKADINITQVSDEQVDKLAGAIRSVGHCLISGAFMIYVSILMHACVGH